MDTILEMTLTGLCEKKTYPYQKKKQAIESTLLVNNLTLNIKNNNKSL